VPLIFNLSCAPLIGGVMPPVPRSESSVAMLRRGSGGHNSGMQRTRKERRSHRQSPQRAADAQRYAA
jgi:hypothetical protein